MIGRLVLLALLSLLSSASPLPLQQETDIDAQLKQLGKDLDAAQLKSDDPPTLKATTCNVTDTVLVAGKPVVFECEFVAHPSANIYWILNGRIVQGSPRRNILEKMQNYGKTVIGVEVRNARFYIDDASAENAGLLEVIADNGHSIVRIAGRLSVDNASNKKQKRSRKIGGVPRIVTWTSSRIEDDGNTVILSCRADRPSRISWFTSEHRALNNLVGYQVLKNGDLMITRATDTLDPICVASNKYGQDSVESFLYVTDPNGSPDGPPMGEYDDAAPL